jgi:CxxC motif-containing protein
VDTKKLVCTVCPNSCSVTVELNESGEPVRVTGNRCPRGEAFARQEITCPVRVIASTVLLRGEDGQEALLPVRSSAAFALSKHAQTMELLRHITVRAPVKMGDVVIHNLLDTGVDVIASCNS